MAAGEVGLGKRPRAWPGKDGKAGKVGVAADGVGWATAFAAFTAFGWAVGKDVGPKGAKSRIQRE